MSQRQQEKPSDGQGRFDFMGVGKYFFILSLITTFGSLFFIMTKGFNYGVDFAGGTEIQIQFAKSSFI